MKWFDALTRGKQIAVSVLFAHFLILAVLAADSWVTSKPIQHKKIAVKTVRFASPSPATKTITKASTPTSSSKKKEVASNKPSAKKQSKAPVKSNGSIATKTPTSSPKQELVAEIEQCLQTLTTIEKPHSKTTLEVPTFNQVIQFETESTEPTPTEQIALFLQEQLQLPDFGEVKAELKIDRFGHLISCKIVDSKSVKNAEFLKKRLPEVQFPCLNETASLTIVFRNEI